MNLPRGERPHLLIIAGPNGSGKSSAYEHSTASAGGISFQIINPDLLADRIRAAKAIDQAAANLSSVQWIGHWLEASILAGHTVGVETVLSTDKYRRLVLLAKQLG